MNLREAWILHPSLTRRGQEEARRRAEVPTHVRVHGANCICHFCQRASRSGRAAA
jgi:hypothetical protein